MNKNIFKTTLNLFILFAASTLLISCTGNEGSFPQVADPPPFDYADGEELRSGMHQLAFALQRLDLALVDDNSYEENPALQRSVSDTLDDIERIGETLQQRDLNTNHPFLVDGMESFLADVDRAQFAAKRNQYYMAGRISGACMSCHRASY